MQFILPACRRLLPQLPFTSPVIMTRPAQLSGSRGWEMTQGANSSDALRGASDGLLIAIREVNARERLKRGVRPADPGFAPLARDVRIAAEEVLRLAREEESRADETSKSEAAAGLPTIDATMPHPDLAGILAEWRTVERRLEAADPASAEAEGLMREFEALRDRYAAALVALGQDI
jgi:hypothetical protein